MKKKPGRGPPGNMHAARSALPALRRLKRGIPLPPELDFVLKAAEKETRPLFDHCGGHANCSETQRLTIANFGELEQLKFIIWQQSYKDGAIFRDPATGQWDLNEGLKRLVPIISAQNKILQTLGMKREAVKVTELQSFFESTEEEIEQQPEVQTEQGEKVKSKLPEKEKKGIAENEANRRQATERENESAEGNEKGDKVQTR